MSKKKKVKRKKGLFSKGIKAFKELFYVGDGEKSKSKLNNKQKMERKAKNKAQRKSRTVNRQLRKRS